MFEIKVAPSILSADFTRLNDQIISLDKAGADWFHIDVMDGHFVPNLTFGAMITKQIRPLTKKIFDVHLMVSNPEDYVKPFAEAGANYLTFHYEACIHHDRLISVIKEHGMKVGIAINPSTNEEVLKYLIDKLDLVLVMTVNPGFGGQSFLYDQIIKISNLKKNYIRERSIEIQVDGGVSSANSSSLIQAGATVLVAGTAVFKDKNFVENILAIKK